MICTDVRLEYRYNQDDIKKAISSRLPLSYEDIGEVRLLKRTLVAEGDRPYYKCTVAFSADGREEGLLKLRKHVRACPALNWQTVSSRLSSRPVVVGAGPAGLFCALALAESGARPIVLERGKRVDERCASVEMFNTLGLLDPECNVQFGEGGAGTFSDGKLKFGSQDKFKAKVLDEFIRFGADPEIAFSSTAHIGTDKLRLIIPALRKYIESLGAEFYFSSKLTDLQISDGSIKAVVFERDGREEILPCERVVLASGHSASDVFEMLLRHSVPMVSKGFGIGVRIEHPREYINKIVYRDLASEIDQTASYHLVSHLGSGRSVYSFCMCPGGSVVAATSGKEGIVTNGMSEYDRMGENSNSALLVSFTPDDFGSSSPLAGIALQRSIEQRAYALTGSYAAPVSNLSHLLEGKTPSSISGVRPSYPVGSAPFALDSYLPAFVGSSIAEAMADFDSYLPGYLYPDAVLTGPETRSTSPVRISRDDTTLESVGVKGLYPAGEGAGYAGGIVSSAADGLRVALAVLEAE